MIERIQTLYANVYDKQKFIESVAIRLEKVPGTLKSHWFSGFFSVPEKYHSVVIEMLESVVKEQIEQLNKLFEI
ncbi:hypothetical protein AWE51_00060 [Aquimarina aggregata]|uniref:Uncharacterized protein n=1 Tax=Aquimarina aggregata TaxID=1642818 RepID=A0A162CTC6_9FLAO|nr:hypothetical protein [Aquimarina aggregata]KZS41874.1 hypothetical protein AWE51_00060 [Aquimarina aggregata]